MHRRPDSRITLSWTSLDNGPLMTRDRGVRIRSHGIALVAVAALVVVSTAASATVTGTARSDTLRGTAKSDKIDGRGDNDRLFGRAGNDVLVGGPGGDLLDGGPGADTLRCGPGSDIAQASPGDRIARDCETVRGLPTVSIGDATIAEGNSQQTLSFPVTLSRAIGFPVTVRYATADGTAVAPTDYAAASGVARIAAGSTTTTIAVTVVGDADVEPDEVLTVTLANAVNAIIADASASGTLRNDDQPRPRAGRYSGMTSQGGVIEFDVLSDLSGVANLGATVDIECPSINFQANDLFIGFDGAVPLTPGSWHFEATLPLNEEGVTGTFSVTGTIAAPGAASGNMRLDLDFSGIRCTTNNVPWSAR